MGVRWPAVLAALLLVGAPARADEKASLPGIEREFREAIRKVTRSTVRCMGKGAHASQDGSSGVIMSKKGLVLSDGDASLVLKEVGEGNRRGLTRSHYADEVQVRVPDLKTGTFKAYTAKVLRRSEAADSMLLRIVDPPSAGFADWLVAGSSDDLVVGDISFAMGNSFGLSAEGPPSLTAGVISSLIPFPDGHAEGRYELLYTSAAVNPGVNGGPLVDVEGRLVGTVSTFALPTPDDPFQFLGKIIPIQRLRKLYGDLPEAAELFPGAAPAKAKSPEAAALEATYHAAAQAAYGAVASLVIERSETYQVMAQVGPNAFMPVLRYQGPVSAVVSGPRGELVTSLYNLTNLATLANPPGPGDAIPPQLVFEKGLATISKITVCYADGLRATAQIVGHDPRLGLALLQADVPDGETCPAPLATVPPETFGEGRFTLAIGNPFGAAPRPSPLLTVGVLSKVHDQGAAWPWRGQWQTDAGVTDANCGGALVDLRGRLYGVLHLWAPLSHGRSSGIGFVVPWASIEAALPRMRENKPWVRGFVGVAWDPKADTPTVASLVAGAPAEGAGLKAGDRLLAVDGHEVTDTAEAARHLSFRWEGESVRLTVERAGQKKPLDISLVLAPRPAK